MADELDKYAVSNETQQNTETEVTTSGTETQTTQTTDTGGQASQTEQAQSQGTVETKPDEFINTFNQRYSSSFKTDDDIKNVLSLTQKVASLEEKANLSVAQTKEIETYKQQLQELRDKGNSEFLEKPLIRQAYVAQQLLEKYPDKDPETLRQIVMSDVDKLSDIDVLVKSQKINHPRLSESDIKAVLYKKHGIDPDTKPEEWDSIARTEIAMDAETARANIKALTSGIELPKTVSKEDRVRIESEAHAKRVQDSTPLKADFTSFDKFKNKKGDFEFDVPSDFKSKLGDTFDAMFIKDGLEPTQENLQMAKELRDAQFLYQHFDTIREIEYKRGQTDLQKKIDEKLSNNQPPNTATASDEGRQTENKKGLAAFLAEN
jgi:hypothetical protein